LVAASADTDADSLRIAVPIIKINAFAVTHALDAEVLFLLCSRAAAAPALTAEQRRLPMVSISHSLSPCVYAKLCRTCCVC